MTKKKKKTELIDWHARLNNDIDLFNVGKAVLIHNRITENAFIALISECECLATGTRKL